MLYHVITNNVDIYNMEEDEDWCDLLKVQAVPHIFLAGDPSSTLQIEGIVPHVGKDGIPRLLCQQIKNIKDILNSADKVHYRTIYHVGKCFLNSESAFVKLELMPQPYAFYNVNEDRSDHSSGLKYAIYTLDSEIAIKSIKGVNGNIQINPKNILDANVYTKIDCNNHKLETNAAFEISTFLPAQVFYTLLLVPYGNKFPRILICKNVITFNDSCNFGRVISRLAQADSYLDKIESQSNAWTILNSANSRSTDFYETDAFINLPESLTGFVSENAKFFWTDRLYYYIWHFSGQPKGDPNFGENEYKRLFECSLEPVNEKLRWNLETEFLNKCFGALVQEIFDWVKDI